MSVNIVYFEDKTYQNFFPLTTIRPVYTMRAGMVMLFQRCQRYFPDCTISLTCREQIASSLAGRIKDYPVNIIKQNGNDILLLNGRVNDLGDLVKYVNESRISTLFKIKNDIIGVLLKTDCQKNIPKVATLEEYIDYIKKQGDDIAVFDTSATLFDYNWEIMHAIHDEICEDYKFFHGSFENSVDAKIHDGVHWVNQSAIHLGNNIEIFPGSVIDASKGPVYVGDNVKIESHVAVYGPAYIGPNTVLTAGKISSSSIGHTCRVGGELEETVFEPYVNKYHAGFIGHSYVGSWVNFGAMTTNSDLKNNYSDIRVTLNGEEVDTNSNKVGSFIGDHTKFGIGTLLNTGINIGIGCNLFGGSLISDKEVAKFSWGNSGNYQKYEFDKFINTAKTVAMRREVELNRAEIDLLRDVYDDNFDSRGIFEI